MKRGGQLDYLIADYLAEVTMCILARSKKKVQRWFFVPIRFCPVRQCTTRLQSAKDVVGSAGAGGYVKEFVTDVFTPLMDDIMSQGIKILTNAGGRDAFARFFLTCLTRTVGFCALQA